MVKIHKGAFRAGVTMRIRWVASPKEKPEVETQSVTYQDLIGLDTSLMKSGRTVVTERFRLLQTKRNTEVAGCLRSLPLIRTEDESLSSTIRSLSPFLPSSSSHRKRV